MGGPEGEDLLAQLHQVVRYSSSTQVSSGECGGLSRPPLDWGAAILLSFSRRCLLAPLLGCLAVLEGWLHHISLREKETCKVSLLAPPTSACPSVHRAGKMAGGGGGLPLPQG